MPDLDVRVEADDAERQRFGAVTSGQVFLYDRASGQLCYQGGIISSRGMRGPSAGREAVESLLMRSPATLQNGPVYGCPLVDSEP